jgi:hypothetical protein
MGCNCTRVAVDRNVPAGDMNKTAILAYDGDDPPFSIRGPHSKVVYNRVRKGWQQDICLADARTLSGLAGFRML